MLKSWTASDIRNLEKGARAVASRADAAEAKAEALTYEMIATAADAAQQQERAEAAEAEVERLRDALATILDCGSIRKAEQLAMAALGTSG